MSVIQKRNKRRNAGTRGFNNQQSNVVYQVFS